MTDARRVTAPRVESILDDIRGALYAVLRIFAAVAPRPRGDAYTAFHSLLWEAVAYAEDCATSLWDMEELWDEMLPAVAVYARAPNIMYTAWVLNKIDNDIVRYAVEAFRVFPHGLPVRPSVAAAVAEPTPDALMIEATPYARVEYEQPIRVTCIDEYDNIHTFEFTWYVVDAGYKLYVTNALELREEIVARIPVPGDYTVTRQRCVDDPFSYSDVYEYVTCSVARSVASVAEAAAIMSALKKRTITTTYGTYHYYSPIVKAVDVEQNIIYEDDFDTRVFDCQDASATLHAVLDTYAGEWAPYRFMVGPWTRVAWVVVYGLPRTTAGTPTAR